MIRLRQRKMFPPLLRNLKTLVEQPDHGHRHVADAHRLTNRVAERKEHVRGLGAEDRDGCSGGDVLRGEAATLRDLVPLGREILPADSPDLPLLVAVRRADARPRELDDARAGDLLHVEGGPVDGVLAAQAEVGGLESRRAPVADGRVRLHVQLVEAAEPNVELIGAPALAVGDREPAEHRGDPQDDAQGLQPGARGVLAHLDPGVAEPLAKSAGEQGQPCIPVFRIGDPPHATFSPGSAIRPSWISTWRPASEAIARSCVTIRMVLPWR